MQTAAVGWTAVVLALVSSLSLTVLGWRAQCRPDGPVRLGQLRLAVLGMVAGAVVAFGVIVAWWGIPGGLPTDFEEQP